MRDDSVTACGNVQDVKEVNVYVRFDLGERARVYILYK